MTCVLTVATPFYVVQVSERLVTRVQAGRVRTFDAAANKTVVFRARDAVVTIGYSGLAFIGSLPTDEWIAETLCGTPLQRFEGHPVTSLGAKLKSVDIGRAGECLRAAISGVKGSDVDKHGLFLNLAGWQGAGIRARPVVVEISRRGGETSVERSHRRWGPQDNFRIYGIGADIQAVKHRTVFAQFRTSTGIKATAGQVEGVLIDLIRSESAANATVGSHLLSVLLTRPDIGLNACRFIPTQPHAARVVTAQSEFEVTVAHTPWVIGPSLVHPPSLAVGMLHLNLGETTSSVNGAPPQNGLSVLNSALRRPSPSGKR